MLRWPLFCEVYFIAFLGLCRTLWDLADPLLFPYGLNYDINSDRAAVNSPYWISYHFFLVNPIEVVTRVRKYFTSFFLYDLAVMG